MVAVNPRTSAVAIPNDAVGDAQSSKAQGFSEPTLRLGGNEGSNFSSRKESGAARVFPEVAGEDPFGELDLVQMFRV